MTLLRVLPCLLVATACAKTEDAPRPPSDAGRGDVGFLAARDCTVCIATECSITLRACEADAECSRARVCRSRCTTADCDAACVAEIGPRSAAASYMEELARCALWSCSATCPPPPVTDDQVLVCRERYAADLPNRLPSCSDHRDCACSACAPELSACFEDPHCADKIGCLSGCPGGHCFCFAPPDASPTIRAAADCIQNRCEPCIPPDGG